jgi:predicted transglutaminase-like cysteine proteinase
VQEKVNSRITYAREAVDRWAPPQETWDSRKGDCEDFALLKRAILIASGIPDEDLFFVLAWDSARREQHAFLIARQNYKSYVLDVPGGLKTMYPVETARDFRPWSAFNGKAIWAYA